MTLPSLPHIFQERCNLCDIRVCCQSGIIGSTWCQWFGAVWMFLADTWCQTSADEMVSRKQKKEERKKDRAERSPESETASWFRAWNPPTNLLGDFNMFQPVIQLGSFRNYPQLGPWGTPISWQVEEREARSNPGILATRASQTSNTCGDYMWLLWGRSFSNSSFSFVKNNFSIFFGCVVWPLFFIHHAQNFDSRNNWPWRRKGSQRNLRKRRLRCHKVHGLPCVTPWTWNCWDQQGISNMRSAGHGSTLWQAT